MRRRLMIGFLFWTLSLAILLFGVVILFTGRWGLSLISVVAAVIVIEVGYRLSGGAENPELYEDKDLFDLLAYAVRSANARIGFHSLRSQDGLLARLQAQGIPIADGPSLRDQIREAIARDRRAFDACRDMMVIQTVHDGHEYFWDGYGTRKTAQWFLKAEVIVDVESSSEALIARLFQLTDQGRAVPA